MSRKSKRRSPKAKINAKINELSWLNEARENDAATNDNGEREPSTDPSPPEENQAEACVQLVVKIPHYLYDYLQQKNMDLTRILQQSLTTAIILAQNQPSLEELSIDIVKSPSR